MTATAAQTAFINDLRASALARVADANADIREFVAVLVSMSEEDCASSREVSFLIKALQAAKAVALRWDVGGTTRPEVRERTREAFIQYVREVFARAANEDAYHQGDLGQYMNWDSEYGDTVQAAFDVLANPAPVAVAESGESETVSPLSELMGMEYAAMPGDLDWAGHYPLISYRDSLYRDNALAGNALVIEEILLADSLDNDVEGVDVRAGTIIRGGNDAMMRVSELAQLGI